MKKDLSSIIIARASGLIGSYILQNLVKEFSRIKQDIYDYISLTTQLAQDEIEDLYEDLLTKMPKNKISESALLPACKELQKMIRQLSAFY